MRHFLNIPRVYELGTKWVGRVPRPIAYCLSQFIADLSFTFYRKAANNVFANLALACPKASEKELSAVARRIFRNYSKYLVDYGRFASQDRNSILASLVSFDGRENLEAAVAMKRGIILLTAHLGNWELGGIFFGSLGLKTNVVTLQDDDREIGDFRSSYRERYNVNTITLGDSPFSSMELVEALHNNEVVAMLIDRYHGRMDNISEVFFGKPTLFPKGPFTLARLTGAPIITAFVVREDAGYKGVIGPPLLIQDESGEGEAARDTIKMLEQYIIMYLDQWFNFILI